MTERATTNTEARDDYEFEVYRSTQDGMLSIRCERWADDADARRLAKAIFNETDDWNIFDKNNSKTWPSETGSHWIAYFDSHVACYVVGTDHWTKTHWLVKSSVAFWQPIVPPSPPESAS